MFIDDYADFLEEARRSLLPDAVLVFKDYALMQATRHINALRAQPLAALRSMSIVDHANRMATQARAATLNLRQGSMAKVIVGPGLAITKAKTGLRVPLMLEREEPEEEPTRELVEPRPARLVVSVECPTCRRRRQVRVRTRGRRGGRR